MDIFEDLLENTKGFPADQRCDLENMAGTLLAISALSRDELQQVTQYVLDQLPELRLQRAQELRSADPEQAKRLEASAKKLARPDADEQFKRRAALVELALRLKVRIPGHRGHPFRLIVGSDSD